MQKKAQIIKNESCQLYDNGKELQEIVLKKQKKTQMIERQNQNLHTEINELSIDLEEISNFKRNLKYELEQEISLKNNIQLIALKYKKLIQEHRREKEKLAQGNA